MAAEATADPSRAKRMLWWAIAVLVLFIGTLILPVERLLPGVGRYWPTIRWILAAAFLLLLVAAMGYRLCGRPSGILISNVNRMSLSQLQIVLWTLLAVSLWMTVALVRSVKGVDPLTPRAVAACVAGLKQSDPTMTSQAIGASCQADPLRVAFPPQLLLAMGISVTSFAGAGLVKSIKGKKAIDLKLLQVRAETTSEQEAAGQGQTFQEGRFDEAKKAKGLLQCNAGPQTASFSDLYRGDEVGDFHTIDVTKVQLLFFTLVLIGVYLSAALMLLLNPSQLRDPLGVDLPAFTNSMNALLALSHGGYLASKSVDKTESIQ